VSPEETKNSEIMDIKLVNSTGETNNIWIGDSSSIADENEIESGGVRDETITLEVVDGTAQVKLTINCAQNGELVKSEEIDITGDYIEGKPIIAIWFGEEFSVTY
jgi:hypothetical protein